MRAHAAHAGVLLADDDVGSEELEALEAHNLLLQGVPRYEPVDVDHPLLADAVRSVHGLQVLHGVPVMLHEDHLRTQLGVKM